jgi:hypothetical protein
VACQDELLAKAPVFQPDTKNVRNCPTILTRSVSEGQKLKQSRLFQATSLTLDANPRPRPVGDPERIEASSRWSSAATPPVPEGIADRFLASLQDANRKIAQLTCGVASLNHRLLAAMPLASIEKNSRASLRSTVRRSASSHRPLSRTAHYVHRWLLVAGAG